MDKKELFLLGAGASKDAGIPDAYEMTAKMLSSFDRDQRYLEIKNVLTFVTGGLLFHEGIKGNIPTGINVEDLFNTVEMLANRQSLEIAPFIGSWHKQIEELDRAEISFEEINQVVESIIRTFVSQLVESFDYHERELDGELERFITDTAFRKYSSNSPSQIIKKIISNPNYQSSIGRDQHLTAMVGQILQKLDKSYSGDVFQSAQRQMILKLADMVWVEQDEDVGYLRPLVRHAYSNKSMIVTLNYDNAIERAANIEGVDIMTGIEQWNKSKNFPSQVAENFLYLLKIHGSIDWKYRNNSLMQASPSMDNFWTEPVLLFGGKNKLTAKGPFLSLLRVLESELDNTSELVVIGYSFRDEHVNEFLSRWFNNSDTNRIKVINSPGFNFGPAQSPDFLHNRKRVSIDTRGAKEAISALYNI